MSLLQQGEEVARIGAFSRGHWALYYVNMAHPSVGEVRMHASSQEYRHPGRPWTLEPRITPAIEAEIVNAVRADGVFRHRIPHTIPWFEHPICHINVLEEECDVGGGHDLVRPVHFESEPTGLVDDFCRKCGRWLQRIARPFEHLFVLDESARQRFPSFLHHDHVRAPLHLLTDAIVLDKNHQSCQEDMAWLTEKWCHNNRVADDTNGNPVIVYVDPGER